MLLLNQSSCVQLLNGFFTANKKLFSHIHKTPETFCMGCMCERKNLTLTSPRVFPVSPIIKVLLPMWADESTAPEVRGKINVRGAPNNRSVLGGCHDWCLARLLCMCEKGGTFKHLMSKQQRPDLATCCQCGSFPQWERGNLSKISHEGTNLESYPTWSTKTVSKFKKVTYNRVNIKASEVEEAR